MSIVDIKVRDLNDGIRSACQFVDLALGVLSLVVLVSDDVTVGGG